MKLLLVTCACFVLVSQASADSWIGSWFRRSANTNVDDDADNQRSALSLLTGATSDAGKKLAEFTKNYGAGKALSMANSAVATTTGYNPAEMLNAVNLVQREAVLLAKFSKEQYSILREANRIFGGHYGRMFELLAQVGMGEESEMVKTLRSFISKFQAIGLMPKDQDDVAPPAQVTVTVEQKGNSAVPQTGRKYLNVNDDLD